MNDPLIYIGFSASSGILDGLIRFFTRGDVTHAFFLYWDPDWAVWMTVGANSNGVTMMTLDEFKKTRKVIHAYRLIWPYYTLWDGLRKHVGDLDTHYNYRGLFGMAGVEITKHITGRPGANLLSEDDELFCSEWCAEVVESAIGLHLTGAYAPNQVDPALLSQILSASPLFEEIKDANNLRIPDDVQ